MASPTPSTDSQHLAAVLRSVAEAIIATDPQGVISLFNPAAEKLFSVTAERAAGQPLRAVIGPLSRWLDRAIAEGRTEPLVFELEFDERYFSASLAPMFEARRVAGWVAVLEDVTHLKKLGQWKSEALQTAAHDLRNPLNLVTGSLNMLRDMLPNPTPAQQECLAMIHTGAERMSALIEDLLNLERVEAGSDITMSKLTLRRVVEQAAEGFKREAREKGLTLVFEGAPATAQVLGDESWLHRAAVNLVSNAVKYTPAGGRVVVRYREGNGQGIMEVEDNGPGIPPAAQARLFERFYRVRGEATRRTPGTGLGLAIVKTIVEKHAGRAWVSSDVGKGSTFGFSLPLLK